MSSRLYATPRANVEQGVGLVAVERRAIGRARASKLAGEVRGAAAAQRVAAEEFGAELRPSPCSLASRWNKAAVGSGEMPARFSIPIASASAWASFLRV